MDEIKLDFDLDSLRGEELQGLVMLLETLYSLALKHEKLESAKFFSAVLQLLLARALREESPSQALAWWTKLIASDNDAVH